MKFIKDVQQSELTKFTKLYLPNITFGSLYLHRGEITPRDLKGILDDVTQCAYDVDALNLLNGAGGILRESVSYSIIYPGMTQNYTFEFQDTGIRAPSPDGIVGIIYSFDADGKPIKQLSIDRIQ